MGEDGTDGKRNGVSSFVIALVVYGLFCMGVLMLPESLISTWNDYLRVDSDKRALLERTAGERIVIVGGSNAAFSINSSLIADTFARPVVNCGTHAGLGLNYMLAEVEPYVHKGDLILVLPEYEQFYGFAKGGPELMELLETSPSTRETVFNRFDLWNGFFVAWSMVHDKASRVINTWRIALGKWRRGVSTDEPQSHTYNREAFGSLGDIKDTVGPERIEKQIPDPLILTADKWDSSAPAAINQFSEHMAQRGARVLVMMPAVSALRFAKEHVEMKNCFLRLGSTLKPQLIGNFEDSILPTDMFFDSNYHLITRARMTRTMYIIELLKLLLPSGDNARN